MFGFIKSWFVPRFTADQTQDMILDLLWESPWVSGRDLRNRLRDLGPRLSLASFYGTMASLEESGRVVGWYHAGSVDGVTVRERWYCLPDKTLPAALDATDEQGYF